MLDKRVISRKIRQIRQEKGLTLDAFKSYLGFKSKTSIYKLENGEFDTVNVDILGKIASMGNKDISWFFEEDGREGKRGPLTAAAAGDEAEEIASLKMRVGVLEYRLNAIEREFDAARKKQQ